MGNRIKVKFRNLFEIYLFVMSVKFLFHIFMCTECTPCACRSQKVASDLLDGALQLVVNCHVGGGN